MMIRDKKFTIEKRTKSFDGFENLEISGAGQPRTVEWMELLKKIQAAGKGLWLYDWTIEEIRQYYRELCPEGLVFSITAGSQKGAEDLLDWFKKIHRKTGGIKMFDNLAINQNERHYLRELAKKYLEYANLPIMEERKKLWYTHNTLKGYRPLIVMEQATFEDDILPASKCESNIAKGIERCLMSAIRNFELIDDDKVIPPYFEVFWKIDLRLFGVDVKRKYAEDSHGKKLGFKEEHPIMDLREDIKKLKPSTYSVDREYTFALRNYVEEVIGDILPIKIKNNSLFWLIAPSQRIVELMGLEAMMFSLIDYPDEMKSLYKFVMNDLETFMKWQEREELLNLNNENDYTGAGSYGFTTELPTDQFKKTGMIRTTDLWGNMNSQETVGVSQDMFGEFIFPYYYELAKKFGLVYYGCCEPVHSIWEKYISKLPGIRKVSVSPWCDEEYMGNVLRGSNTIYSRKPSPNFVGVEGMFDENAFADHIIKTLKAAKGCGLEFIFRDIYTLSGDVSKPGKAVKITKNLIEKMW